ncbi:MAG: RNA methyltransferase [Planctomycetota bacterium]|nr:RNA methyltransferase [Planctomycetota bacterium]
MSSSGAPSYKVHQISSTSNDRVKQLSSLAMAKYRRRHGQFIAEGDNVLSAAIRFGHKPSTVIVEESSAREYAQRFVPTEDLLVLNEKCMNKVCESNTPKGVAGVFPVPQETDTSVLDQPELRALAAFEVQEPGNLGALLRIAAASSFNLFIAVGSCADHLSPKAVRGSAGAVFAVNILRMSVKSFLSFVKHEEVEFFCAAGGDGSNYRFTPRSEKAVLLIGSEGSGIPDSVLRHGLKVSIPMREGWESLNAAVAAGILAFGMPAFAPAADNNESPSTSGG